MNIRKTILSAIVVVLIAVSAFGQEPAAPSTPLNPVDTVKEFYRLLRDKKYVEGFRLSVYRSAVENLSPGELKELEPDFDNTFSKIPEELKVLGSQTNGLNSTVFIKANTDPKDLTADEVTLIQIDNQWIIGDQETLSMVRELGNKFFFEVRVRVNEDSTQQYMERYIGAEKLYFDANKGIYGSMDELVRANFWPQNLKNGEMAGYKFTIELNKDKRDFWVHAEPLNYAKSGRFSFYADLKGVYKFDKGGQVYRVQLAP